MKQILPARILAMKANYADVAAWRVQICRAVNVCAEKMDMQSTSLVIHELNRDKSTGNFAG
jgi:hypothetical protein